MATDNDAVRETVAEIERLLGGSVDLGQIFPDLPSSKGNGQTVELTALRAAVSYCFPLTPQHDDDLFGPLIPLLVADGKAMPRPVDRTDDSWHQVWATAAEVASHPALLARLHDLLWLVKHGDEPHRHAQCAFTAYLSASELPWSGTGDFSVEDSADAGELDAIDGLRRARDLGREIRHADADAQVASASLAALQAELSRARAVNQPGISGRLFSLAVECGPDALMEPLRECTEKMLDLYCGNEWASDDLLRYEIQFARRFADPAEARRLQGQRVRHWLAAAQNANPGLARSLRIQRAIEMAEHAGDSNLIREARANLNSVEMSESDFHSSSIEVDLPASDLNALVAEIVGEDSLPDALCRLALLDPQSWSEEEVQGIVGEMSSVFLELVQIKMLDEAGRLVFAASTPDERAQYKEAQARQLLLGMSRTALIEPVLAGIQERHWTDSSGAELSQFFAAAWSDSWIVEGLARAFLYWHHDAGEEATVLALRRIERIVRDLCQECGDATWVPPKPKARGHAQGFGTMLRGLRGHVDDPLWQYLNWTLSDPLGLNLRAKYFHALDTAVPAPMADAVTVLQAVLYLWRDRVQRNAAAAEREGPDQASV